MLGNFKCLVKFLRISSVKLMTLGMRFMRVNAMSEARKAYRVKKGILDYNIRKMLAKDIVMAINFPF